MLVSVIIPTFRRPDLCRRAVISVLNQTYVELEVLVVIDGPDDGTRAAIESLNDPRAIVLEGDTNRGPAYARNRGVERARGAYACLLDDDDEWLPQKLAAQMQAVEQLGLRGRDFLFSCRSIIKCDALCCVEPKKLYQGDDISEYLLHRPHPFGSTGLVASGTLLFPRDLALRVPFPDDQVHEDWSWLLLCIGREHVPLFMLPDALFVYHVDHGPSRNVLTDWRKSVEWGRRYRAQISGRAFAALLATTTARRARHQVGIKSWATLAGIMRQEARPEFMHWVTLAGLMLLPANLLEKLWSLKIRRKIGSSGTVTTLPVSLSAAAPPRLAVKEAEGV